MWSKRTSRDRWLLPRIDREMLGVLGRVRTLSHTELIPPPGWLTDVSPISLEEAWNVLDFQGSSAASQTDPNLNSASTPTPCSPNTSQPLPTTVARRPPDLAPSCCLQPTRPGPGSNHRSFNRCRVSTPPIQLPATSTNLLHSPNRWPL